MSRYATAIVAVVAAFASVLAATAGAQATETVTSASHTYVLKATLDTKQQVPAPRAAGAARGVFTATLVVNGKRSSLTWQLKLSGLTGTAQVARLAYGELGKAGSLAMPLCDKCRAAASGAYNGPYVATARFVTAILHGGMYATVTTKLNPKGEIRGQIKATSK